MPALTAADAPFAAPRRVAPSAAARDAGRGPAQPAAPALRAEPETLRAPAPGAESAAFRALRARLAAAAFPGRQDRPEAAREIVAELAARDRDVRAHEMAHVNAGRPWAGPPSYEFQRGPDGRRYAVAGHVPIDVAPVKGDPEATAEKMRVVAAAALAPAEPSAADRRIAAIARARMQEALAALAAAGPAAASPALSLRV